MIDRYFRLCHDLAGDLDILGQKAAEQYLVDLVGLVLGTRGRKSFRRRFGMSPADMRAAFDQEH